MSSVASSAPYKNDGGMLWAWRLGHIDNHDPRSVKGLRQDCDVRADAYVEIERHRFRDGALSIAPIKDRGKSSATWFV